MVGRPGPARRPRRTLIGWWSPPGAKDDSSTTSASPRPILLPSPRPALSEKEITKINKTSHQKATNGHIFRQNGPPHECGAQVDPAPSVTSKRGARKGRSVEEGRGGAEELKTLACGRLTAGLSLAHLPGGGEGSCTATSRRQPRQGEEGPGLSLTLSATSAPHTRLTPPHGYCSPRHKIRSARQQATGGVMSAGRQNCTPASPSRASSSLASLR